MPAVLLQDLEVALDWVSTAGSFDNSACVDLRTGRVHWYGDAAWHEAGDEPPDPSEAEMLPLPHRNDLDLGRDLVQRFVDEHLPGEADRVAQMFRSRGAYRRFHDLLERFGLDEAWQAYERRATREALLAWAAENELEVTGVPAEPPPRAVPATEDPVLAQLRRLEPQIHGWAREATRASVESLTAPAFWEIGASGQRYTRADVLASFAGRSSKLPACELADHRVDPVGSDVVLLTYVLRIGERVTQRATLWRRVAGGWQAVFHQGTVAAP